MRFCAEKDLALCGLACVLCGKEDCPGCKARGCAEVSECSVYKCVMEKELDGCYECGDFPCEEKMLQGARNRAFNRYAGQFGKEVLLARLRTNYDNGITYHKPGGLNGDYDLLSNEDEIIRLIHFGSHDPYVKCPVLETERFILRLVRTEDAVDLLKCYSDPQAQEIFNADSCTSDFRYKTVEEMQGCIEFWLWGYKAQAYVRFAIVDKSLDRAVGTIEMFNATGRHDDSDGRGVLRLDLASLYETKEYLEELLKSCVSSFYLLFNVKSIVSKAIPSAKERITALRSVGFMPFDWQEPGRDHYWLHGGN